jgi:D-beta-D-heptose 7-phosphate kinase/D-beta-D-heptose 1-phosphate adenosyltransferase
MGRVVAPRSFAREAARLRKRGRRVVFTNGVFDLLHYGHVSYLQKARRLGDALFVAVNSDASARRLKGRGRPLMRQDDRMRTLAALACVDFVSHFDEETPARIIEAVRPRVLVKGADYKKRDIVGADFVQRLGGRVARIPLAAGRSTTALIRKIRRLP